MFRDVECLSPMVRASTLPLRLLALDYGADFTYTEELIDRAIINTERVVNEDLNTIDYVKVNQQQQSKKAKKAKKVKQQQQPTVLQYKPSVESKHLFLQIGTSNASFALQAANHITPSHIVGVDVNMGCPKKFSVQDNMGSALLKDVKTATDIVKTLRNNVDPSLQVTAKIRLIHDESDPKNKELTTKRTVDFVKSLENAGANAIAIHARTVNDTEADSARWEELKPVIDQASVPVIANGDIYTREDMENIKKVSGASGVMLARGALYNLSVFKKDNELLPQETVVQSYLSYCVKFSNHVANTKYVICEMINGRRTPLALRAKHGYHFPKKQSVGETCKCKSLDDLCKLWDVNLSLVGGRDGSGGGGGGGGGGGSNSGSGNNCADGSESQPTLRKYDDAYFLDDKYKDRETKRQKI